ncbi:hypothetical protein V8E54_001930 [Elaphomyces granulatus]
MVLRGKNRRMAQLPDLVTISLLGEGPTPCDASENNGRKLNIAAELMGWTQEAGFNDVQQQIFFLPDGSKKFQTALVLIMRNGKARGDLAPPPPPLVLRPRRLLSSARAARRDQIPGAPMGLRGTTRKLLPPPGRGGTAPSADAGDLPRGGRMAQALRPGSAHNEVERHDLAGSGFLRLLRVLRTVFLQDSVVLRPLFPDHPVWKADVLATDAYRAFATRVTAACEAVEEPGDLQIKKALPVVNDRLNMMQAEVKMLRANVERVEEKVDRVEGKVDMRHDRLEEKMDKLAADMRELKTLVQKQGSGKSLRSSTVRTAAAIRVRAADPDPHPGNPRPSGPNVVQTLGSAQQTETM